MKNRGFGSMAIGALLLSAAVTAAQTPQSKYADVYRDPVIRDIRADLKAEENARQAETDAVRKRQAAEKAAVPAKKELQLIPGDFERPVSPDAFKSAFHFPPLPQDETGGCWCFAGTSFMESEAARLSGKKVKLSEMYVIYWEYVERARRYVRERGESRVSLGSEVNAVPRMMKMYGIVPQTAYTGLVKAEHFQHNPMLDEIQNYLEYVKEWGYWDEEVVLDSVRGILNRHMGEPPATIEFEGKTMTPKEFMSEALRINPDDYVTLMSTMSSPFYTRAMLDVLDNWWKGTDYINVPLEDWHAALRGAVAAGYSVGLCGDTSEPGYRGEMDIAVVPDFDIPAGAINQDARELRIANEATSDDHCVHLVGLAQSGGHDWFLIKDSSQLPPPGKFWGYIFYRDDYVRLKMLIFMAHKDALKDLLAKVKSEK